MYVFYGFSNKPIIISFVTVISLLIGFKNINNYNINKIYNIIILICIIVLYVLIVFLSLKVLILNTSFDTIQYVLFIPFGICIYKLIV